LWGALSDERTGLSFVCAAGLCQCSLSQVLVSCDSRPHFTGSDLRLPFSSPPTTRRVTVEVFDPASTRVVCLIWFGSVLFIVSKRTHWKHIRCPAMDIYEPQRKPLLRHRSYCCVSVFPALPTNGSTCHNIQRPKIKAEKVLVLS
jgi:hypothetical protein